MIIYETTKCVICGEPAEYPSGHCHKEKIPINAGFCKKHDKEKYTPKINPQKYCHYKYGCFGKWKRKFGIRKWKISHNNEGYFYETS